MQGQCGDGKKIQLIQLQRRLCNVISAVNILTKKAARTASGITKQRISADIWVTHVPNQILCNATSAIKILEEKSSRKAPGIRGMTRATKGNICVTHVTKQRLCNVTSAMNILEEKDSRTAPGRTRPRKRRGICVTHAAGLRARRNIVGPVQLAEALIHNAHVRGESAPVQFKV